MSLALGSNEVNILEMTSAYGVFANMGVKADPVSILKIEDRNGNILFTHTVHQKSVFNANLIAALVNLMRGVILRGTGIAAGLGERPVAGKTGTTGDYRDAWFIGFVPQLVTAAWVGNNDNSPMAGITGGSIPAQMWHDYMVYATKDLPIQYFPNPSGYISQRICSMSGGLATTFCPSEKVVEELVWANRPVEENCTYHTNFITLGEGPSRPDWETTIFPDITKTQTLVNPTHRVRISPAQKKEEKKNARDGFDAKKGF
jgi:penicillin-binding protein 1A